MSGYLQGRGVEHDVLTLAQHCRTYGDGEIWEAACRVLRAAFEHETGADDKETLALEVRK